MIKRNVYFDFGLPVSMNIFELDDTPIFFYQRHMMVLLVLSGALTIERQGETKECKEGEIVLMDCNTPLAIYSDKQPAEKAAVLALNINVSHYRELFPHIECTIFSQVEKSLESDVLSCLLGIALTLLDHHRDMHSLLDDNVKSLLSIILDDCQYFSNRIKKNYLNQHTRLEYNNLMQNIILYIHTHLVEKVSLKVFAQQNHLSENYLSHLIKKISGTAFKDLLSRIRCRNSEVYLLDSSKKINEIAYLVGFSTSAYYKDNFLKLYKMTPEQYRERYLKLAAVNHFPPDCSTSQSSALLRDFAGRHNISLSLSSERFFTADTVYVDRCIERFQKVLSDEGEINNIDAEMNSNSYQAFVNMQKEFRMSIITIDAVILVEQNSSSLAIAKNINYLINSGFKISFNIYSLSTQLMFAIVKFMMFYSRRFIDTLEEIDFFIKADCPEKELLAYKRLLFEKLQETVGPRFKIEINTKLPKTIKYFPAIYDSFILTPFAMDELFHPENWDIVIDFSLIDSVDRTGNIMANGDGLLTWNGIKKPWWHAYHLSSKLRGNIISKGVDHIITNNNGLITILTYNTCGLAHSYLQRIGSNEQLFDIIQNKKHVREHCFQLLNIFGTYKMLTYSVDEAACLFSKWAKLGYPQYLTIEEEDILSQICHPQITFDTIKAEGKINITTKEESFGVTCVVLEKL